MNHRFLKLAGGLLAVLVLAYVGASWYAGRLAQQSIEAWVNQTNQSIASQWTAKSPGPVLRIQSYERGVFSSAIRYALDYQDARGTRHELGLQDALRHGPWPWGALRSGNWRPVAAYSRVTPTPDGDWKLWADAMPAGTPPWVARSRIGFDGGVTTEVQVAPVKTAEVDFGGGSLRVIYAPNERQTQLAGRFETLTLTDPGVQTTLRFSGLALQARSRHSGQSDYQSHQEMRLEGLALSVADDQPIVLKQQVLTVDVARTGDLMDSLASFEAAHLLFGIHDVGALKTAAAAQNLSVPALQALVRTLASIDARHEPGSDLSVQDRQQIRAGLLPLLAASPRIALSKLQWVNAQGTTELSGQADFRPVGDDASQDLGVLVDQGIRGLSVHAQVSKPMLLQVLRQTQSGSDADVALALVSMVFDQYAGRLARVGLVRRSDEGVIQADLAYADGQVTVNGVKMTPDEFSQRLAALQGRLF
ncbi:YdgA family protein [Castellaniella sp.]|uniref:YdgA family protein n=1 Tax=Castellaniella sp. TaxID=1955812 RepID=UPI0025C30258|nr:YdgA family protein [Castellaniella sp.]